MYTLPRAGGRVGSKSINPGRSIDMPIVQVSREEGWATKTSKKMKGSTTENESKSEQESQANLSAYYQKATVLDQDKPHTSLA